MPGKEKKQKRKEKKPDEYAELFNTMGHVITRKKYRECLAIVDYMYSKNEIPTAITFNEAVGHIVRIHCSVFK